MTRTTLGSFLLVSSVALLGCPSNEGGARIGAEEPEQVQLPQIKVTLPPAPSFQKEHAPEKYPDGAYSVYGARKDTANTLNKPVRVKGFILEVYECPPCPKGATCKTCDKPHLYLADRASGPKEEALLVTDYPKEEGKTKKKTKFDLGAQYYFNGTFSKTSPTGFASSTGLLVFSEAKRVDAQ